MSLFRQQRVVVGSELRPREVWKEPAVFGCDPSHVATTAALYAFRHAVCVRSRWGQRRSYS